MVCPVRVRCRQRQYGGAASDGYLPRSLACFRSSCSGMLRLLTHPFGTRCTSCIYIRFHPLVVRSGRAVLVEQASARESPAGCLDVQLRFKFPGSKPGRRGGSRVRENFCGE